MKFIKIFGFLGIIVFVFSTKVVIGQHYEFHYDMYPPLFEKNYENDFKQIKKIILVEPNPKVRFSGIRGVRVSLKRIARVEKRTTQLIECPIVRIIGKDTPVIEYKPDSATKVQLQEFLKKLIANKVNLDLLVNYDTIKNRQFFEDNKINYSLPHAIDSIKETNYIFFTYYNGEIITGTNSRSSFTNRAGGLAYIFLINKKNNTVCYLDEVYMTPYRGDFSSLIGQSLRKLRKDIEKSCQSTQ